MLAQREDGEARGRRARRLGRNGQQAAFGGLAHEEVERGFERGVGEIGERCGGVRRGPGAAGFGDGRPERGAALGIPQAAGKRGFVIRAPGLGEVGEHEGNCVSSRSMAASQSAWARERSRR